MNCKEVKIGLHDFIDGVSDDFLKHEIDNHLRSCDKCFNDYKKLKIFFDKLKDLPVTIEPPKEIILTLSSKFMEKSLQDKVHEETETNIKRIKKEQNKLEKNLKRSRAAVTKSFISRTIMVSSMSNKLHAPSKIIWVKIILTLLPLILITAGYFIYDYQKYNSPWKVTIVEGKITVNGKMNHSGLISQGESLFAGEESQAVIYVPLVGKVEVSENSLIVLEKAKDRDNKIFLKKGSIKISNSSDMPDLSIGLKNCTVSDRGGIFTVAVDDTENARITVDQGFVELNYLRESFFLNEGYLCDIKNGMRPGIPYSEDASDSLKNEVKRFSYNYGGDNSIDKIISLAKESDMLTLLALIPRASQLKRQILFQHIANHFPPPSTVTRMEIIKADRKALYLWWQEIEWQL